MASRSVGSVGSLSVEGRIGEILEGCVGEEIWRGMMRVGG